MDNFLIEQYPEGRVSSAGTFTLSPEDTRRKLLNSAPKKPPEAKLLLLCDALWQAGYDPATSMNLSIFRWEYDYFVRKITIRLKGGKLSRPRVLFEALKEPFHSSDAALTQFTRFAYWTAGQGFPINLKWPGGKLCFQKNSLEVTGKLPEESSSLSLQLKLPDGDLPHDSAKRARKSTSMHWTPSRLLPEEAFCGPHSDSGYFDGRCKPFTLLKRFVQSEESTNLKIDLWESPYSEVSPGLTLMDRAKPGRWLYRLWRPNYGRPALMLQYNQGQSHFGQLRCKAVFWVECKNKPALVSLSRGDFFRDFVPIEGPPGLRAYVIWEKLKTDTFGWQFVKNDEYRQALIWCEEQASLMTSTLHEHWDDIFAAANKYGLVKKRADYQEDVKLKMKLLWGKPKGDCGYS